MSLAANFDQLPLDAVLQQYGNINRLTPGGTGVLPQTGPLANRLAPRAAGMPSALGRLAGGMQFSGGADTAGFPLAQNAAGQIASDPSPFRNFSPVNARALGSATQDAGRSALGRLGGAFDPRTPTRGLTRGLLGRGLGSYGYNTAGRFLAPDVGSDVSQGGGALQQSAANAASVGATLGNFAGPVGAAVGSAGVGAGDLIARSITGQGLESVPQLDFLTGGNGGVEQFSGDPEQFKENLKATGLDLGTRQEIIDFVNAQGKVAGTEGAMFTTPDEAMQAGLEMAQITAQAKQTERALFDETLARQAFVQDLYNKLGGGQLETAEQNLALINSPDSGLEFLPPEVQAIRRQAAERQVNNARMAAEAYTAQAMTIGAYSALDQQMSQIDSFSAQLNQRAQQDLISQMATGGDINQQVEQAALSGERVG